LVGSITGTNYKISPKFCRIWAGALSSASRTSVFRKPPKARSVGLCPYYRPNASKAFVLSCSKEGTVYPLASDLMSLYHALKRAAPHRRSVFHAVNAVWRVRGGVEVCGAIVGGGRLELAFFLGVNHVFWTRPFGVYLHQARDPQAVNRPVRKWIQSGRHDRFRGHRYN